MANSTLNLDECAVKLHLEAHHHDDKFNRLQYLRAVAQHPKLGVLGTMLCLLVDNRYVFKRNSDFLQIMEEENDEMKEFATTLFDAQGNVRPWLVDLGYRRGSGCWGAELSTGGMVYIQDLTVKNSFRKRGVGSLILQQLFRSSFVLTLLDKATIFCRLMRPRDEIDVSNWDAKLDRVRFFRNNGFRRIGRTSFFGYSSNPNHPSRQLPMRIDPERLGNGFICAPDVSPEQMQREYPLHSAIATNKTDRIAAILVSTHASDPAKIRQRDRMGFTPLHVAASVSNVFAVRALFEMCAAGDLRNASNKEHLTPLDRLQETMRQTREFAETTLGVWDGHPREALVCEYILRKALRVPPILESEEVYIMKRRFGCTCGLCTDQWLSPRMRFCLKVTSEVDYDNMSTDLDSFKSNEPLPMSLTKNTDYLPIPLRTNMHKAFFQGYCALFSALETILSNSDYGPPTASRILAYARDDDPDNVNFYIENGGRVDYALDAIMDCAMEQSVLGDGEFEVVWDDPAQVCGSEVVNMPRCANDLAFMLVRQKMGIDPEFARGPYDEDVDMHGEDEDDEDY